MHSTLSRRELLQTGALALAGASIAPWASAQNDAPSRKALYLPSLHDRAKLAIRCLISHADAARGYVPYFYTRMSDPTPSMFLCVWSYGDGMGRSVDALALLRQITGEGLDQPADRAMRSRLIGGLGEDGLSWVPAEPWLMPVPHTRPTWLQQGAMLAFTSLYQLTGEARYKHYVERMIRALDERLVRKPGEPATFPGDIYTHADGWGPKPVDATEPFVLYCSATTMPLLRYYRLTRFEPALRLANDLIDAAVREFNGGEKFFEHGHFHCESRIMTSLLQRGVLCGQAADLALGEKLYRKALKLGTLSGWFPEQVNNPAHNRSNLAETCSLTDMLESAILLARHRNPAYWHDVERFTRNHLLVHQIVDIGWEKQMTPTPNGQHLLRYPGDTQPQAEGAVRSDQVMGTLLGGFVGWGGVTALSDDSLFGNTNQHCCNAAGARALYDVWHAAVADDAGVFSVNLHTHRHHAAAEVVAAEAIEPRPVLPGQADGDAVGALQIKMKLDRRLKVRVPEFLTARDLVVRVNGQGRPLTEAGAYADLGAVRAGDSLEVLYPMKPRTTEEKIAPGTFTFRWRGPTVVGASPEQKIRPLFKDARFLTAPPTAGPVPGKEIEPV